MNTDFWGDPRLRQNRLTQLLFGELSYSAIVYLAYWSSSGEAETGSAGEQPVEEYPAGDSSNGWAGEWASANSPSGFRPSLR